MGNKINTTTIVNTDNTDKIKLDNISHNNKIIITIKDPNSYLISISFDTNVFLNLIKDLK